MKIDDSASKPIDLPPNSESGTEDVNIAVGQAAVEFAQHAEKLSHHHLDSGEGVDGVAVEAQFVTPLDAVIVTSEGNRLPGVPLEEAHKLNVLREELEASGPVAVRIHEARNGETHAAAVATEPFDREKDRSIPIHPPEERQPTPTGGPLGTAMPPMHTSPLFPPLPLYGPPSTLRNVQCIAFRISSFFLSLAFLGVIVLGSLFTSVGPFAYRLWMKLTFRDPDRKRPFYQEEQRRRLLRQEQERKWKRRLSNSHLRRDEEGNGEFVKLGQDLQCE